MADFFAMSPAALERRLCVMARVSSVLLCEEISLTAQGRRRFRTTMFLTTDNTDEH
jgi:hypothetical protein